jgi:hypothetical protein
MSFGIMSSVGDQWAREPVSLGSPDREWHMMSFGWACALITLPKSLFTWKTVGILKGVKLAALAAVLGLARAGLLPQWFPHWG